MRRWKWVLFGWAFIGWVFIIEAPDLWAVRTDPIEKDLTQKKKDLKEIKKELSRTKEEEKKIQGKESSILESLHQIETELYKKGKELGKMEIQLAQTKEKLDQTKNQILMLNKGMGHTKEELFSRLHALYKMGRTPPGTLLLASPSYLDLLKMDKYLRVIIDYDNRLVETHRYQVALKESYQRELIQDQAQWQRSISEVEKKKEEIKPEVKKEEKPKETKEKPEVEEKTGGEEGKGKS